MIDFGDYKVDLDTARPNPTNNTQVVRGDSPRTAFSKYNDMLDAVHQVTRHVGPLAPSPTSPWMQWLDTSIDPHVERQRNSIDTAWVLATVNGALRVDSNGNVGIGVSDPDAPLVIKANSASYGISVRGRSSDSASLIAFRSNNNSTELARLLRSSDGNLAISNTSGGSSITLTPLGSSGNSYFSFTSAGNFTNVGTNDAIHVINQTDPVATNNKSPIISLRKAGVISFNLSCDGGNTGLTRYDAKSNTGQHQFYTDGVERVKISPPGNLLVGITSSSARLHVQGSGGANDLGFFQQGGTSSAVVVINHEDPLGTNPGSRPVLSLRKGNVTSFNLSVDGTTLGATYYDAIGPNGQHRFYTNGTERLTVRESGFVGIGTPTPTARLDVSSDTLRLRTAKTPASGTATGNAGDVCWDASYIYVCVATNTWKRSAIATW
jgi:hypothetical protein